MADGQVPTSPDDDAVGWFDAEAPDTPSTPDTPGTPGTPGTADTPGTPGSTTARGQGCVCSVLGNAAYRVGAAERPLIDPDCTLHRPAPGRVTRS